MNLSDIKQYYSKEINMESFEHLGDDFIRLFILFKETCKIEFEESAIPRIVMNGNVNETQIDQIANCLLLGGEDSPISTEENLLKDMSYFFSQYDSIFGDKVEVYQNKDARATHIKLAGGGDLDLEINQRLLITGIMPRIYPWLFGELPKDYIKHSVDILSGDMRFYRKEFDEYIKHSGIQNDITISKLKKKGDEIVQRKMQQYDRDIANYNESINSMLREIAEKTELIRNLQCEKMGYMTNSDAFKTPIDEMFDVIKGYKDCINVIDMDGDNLVLSFVSDFMQFEDNEYRACIANDPGSSWFFNHCVHSTDDVKKFYKEVFETGKIKIVFNSILGINVVNGRIENYCDRHREEREENAMMHPHINSDLTCFGNNSTYISQFVRESRFSEMINLLIQCSRQYTVNDRYAGRHFVEALFKDEDKCVRLPNGQYVTANQAINYIREHKEEFPDD